MGQVTLYLDSETQSTLKAAAESAGTSQSRWVANLIRQRAGANWPDSVAQLAGAWSDLPSAEELRHDQGEDIPRESL